MPDHPLSFSFPFSITAENSSRSRAQSPSRSSICALGRIQAYSSQENIYTVRRDGLYGFYRTDGSPLLEPNYAAVGPYSGGMAAVSPGQVFFALRRLQGLHCRHGRHGLSLFGGLIRRARHGDHGRAGRTGRGVSI